MKQLIDKLEETSFLKKEEFTYLINNRNLSIDEYLFEKSEKVRQKHYGRDIYIRGLIEFTNYCKNDCRYCGIRKSNKKAERYRLTNEQILECCKTGYSLGFRTFVLQGGEDPYFTDEHIITLITDIKKLFPDCAVTLSVGEKSYDSYLAFFKAGADRYLLRHETANEKHYSKLHPPPLLLENRKQCLRDLKEIGFQIGTGFMVGSPFQTSENLAEDLCFLNELQPHMVGIGPYISHKDTPFHREKNGSLEMTLFLIGIIRLMLPNALIPSTTSLGTIDNTGRERGILAGANVVMPNLSPIEVREKYLLYDNKISTGEEAAECCGAMERRMNSIGYQAVVDRGDFRLLDI